MNFDNTVFGDREYFYKSVKKMMGSLFENVESLDDYEDNDDVGRYKDDTEQLNIPTIQKSQRYHSYNFYLYPMKDNLIVDGFLL